MSYSLLIIDMQSYFSAAHNSRVLKGCTREIKRAMQDKAAIIYLEYGWENYEPTLPILTNLTDQYKRAYHVFKYTDDGSKEAADLIWRHNLPKRNIRVAGVNSNFCVRSTVEGLIKRMPHSRVHVIADACDCNSTASHRDGLSAMKQLPNVKLLRHASKK
jgi:hypothetical protein